MGFWDVWEEGQLFRVISSHLRSYFPKSLRLEVAVGVWARDQPSVPQPLSTCGFDCLFKIFFMCMSVLSSHMFVHGVSTWCPSRLEDTNPLEVES